MANDKTDRVQPVPDPLPVRALTPQAQRALAEAEARRAEADSAEQARQKAIEEGGPAG